jgi:hypothetical protein
MYLWSSTGINEHYSSLQRQALFLRVQLGSTMD